MGNIFKKSSDTIYHNGKGNGVISNGDSQTTVNEKLAKAIKELQDNKCSDKCDGNGTISTKDIKNSSSISLGESVSVYKKYPIDVIPTESNIGVSYDITNLVGEKNTMKRVSIIGMRNGKRAELMSSDKTSNTVTLLPNSFPIEVKVEVENLEGSEREKITGSSYLQGGKESLSEVSYKRYMGISDVKSQEDINLIFDKRLKDLSKESPVIETVTIDGSEVTLANAVKMAFAEASKIPPKESIEYTRKGSTQKDTLENVINELFRAIEYNSSLIDKIK